MCMLIPAPSTTPLPHVFGAVDIWVAGGEVALPCHELHCIALGNFFVAVQQRNPCVGNWVFVDVVWRYCLERLCKFQANARLA